MRLLLLIGFVVNMIGVRDKDMPIHVRTACFIGAMVSLIGLII